MQELLDRLAKVELSTDGAFSTAQALNDRLQKLDGQVSCPILDYSCQRSDRRDLMVSLYIRQVK